MVPGESWLLLVAKPLQGFPDASLAPVLSISPAFFLHPASSPEEPCSLKILRFFLFYRVLYSSSPSLNVSPSLDSVTVCSIIEPPSLPSYCCMSQLATGNRGRGSQRHHEKGSHLLTGPPLGQWNFKTPLRMARTLSSAGLTLEYSSHKPTPLCPAPPPEVDPVLYTEKQDIVVYERHSDLFHTENGAETYQIHYGDSTDLKTPRQQYLQHLPWVSQKEEREAKPGLQSHQSCRDTQASSPNATSALVLCGYSPYPSCSVISKHGPLCYPKRMFRSLKAAEVLSCGLQCRLMITNFAKLLSVKRMKKSESEVHRQVEPNFNFNDWPSSNSHSKGTSFNYFVSFSKQTRMSQETAAYGELQLCLESQLTVLGSLPFHTQLDSEEVLQEEEPVLEEAEHRIHPSKQQKVIDLEESGEKIFSIYKKQIVYTAIQNQTV
ncbi:hypothetical protein STEG23_023594 [Scotinomys teguina]